MSRKQTSIRPGRHINLPIFIPDLACPGQCIFCHQKHITARVEAPSPDQAAGMLDDFIGTADPGAEIELAFFGGSFTALDLNVQARYLKIAQPYIKTGRLQGVRISTRPDCINEEILDLLGEGGVTTIELGVQSFSDQVLTACRRGYDAAAAVSACRLAKSRGFALGIQLMAGLPGDTPSYCQAGAWLCGELGADQARIYPALVLEDTELAGMYRRGEYCPWSLEQSVEVAAEMLLIMESFSIKVIRIGLQDEEGLKLGQAVIAGPCHPAFGELVQQHIYYRLAVEALERFQAAGENLQAICLQVPRGHVSRMVGQHRANLTILKAAFGLRDIKVSEETAPEVHDESQNRLESAAVKRRVTVTSLEKQ